MFIGHYGPSFVAKRVDPTIPLWVLVLSAHLMDVFWTIFVILGIERMRIVPGYTRTNPLDLYYQPYTHGLPGACAWALAAAIIYRVLTRNTRAAAIVGATVLSHWLLDLIVHRRDLALWDNHDKVGLGLWNYPIPSLTLECVLVFGGIMALLAANRSRPRGRLRWLPPIGVLMFALQVSMFVLPTPPSPDALVSRLLAFYVVLTATAFWIDRGNRAVV